MKKIELAVRLDLLCAELQRQHNDGRTPWADSHDLGALLEAAAALRTVGDGWQPIETAPNNETVLGVVDGETRLIRWGKTSHVPIYGWCLADQGAEDFDICHPTLWQPLPPPPKAAPSGDEG